MKFPRSRKQVAPEILAFTKRRVIVWKWRINILTVIVSRATVTPTFAKWKPEHVTNRRRKWPKVEKTHSSWEEGRGEIISKGATTDERHNCARAVTHTIRYMSWRYICTLLSARTYTNPRSTGVPPVRPPTGKTYSRRLKKHAYYDILQIKILKRRFSAKLFNCSI